MSKISCFVAAFLVVSGIGWSKPPELERRLTVSSGYIERYFNSNEGLIHAPLTAMQGYSKLFDVVADNFSDHWGKRLATALLEAPVSYWLSNSLFVPFHEFGHARFAAAHGNSYSYGSFSYGREFSDISNFWSLSALRLITPPFFIPGTGIAYTRSMAPPLTNEQRVTFSAGGINNQMLLAKKIGTMIYEKNGHITNLQHYVGNKITGFVYSILDQDQNPHNDFKVNNASDPGSILQNYQALGYNINHRDLKMASLISLLSGSTAALFRGYYDYVHHNDPIVRPLEIAGVRVPEINSYINARGLSFEVETDYRIAPYLTAGLAYEFIWKGGVDHNVTPRARYNLASAFPALSELWLRGDIVIGRGVGGSFGADYAPFALDANYFWSRFAYSADLHVYNAKTLYGERNIISVQNGKTAAAEVILALHMRY